MTRKAQTTLGNQRAGHAGALTAALRRAEGSQLLEFALVLPLLLVLVLGIFDFATAFNLKQIMNNAAREGSRIGSSQPNSDLTQTTPPSVQVIHDAVVSYLSNAGVNTSFISGDMTSAGSGTFTWTYYSDATNGYGLKIERNVQLDTPSGPIIAATRVTLTYPYNWWFGFNKVIKLIVPAASYSGTIAIRTDALMGNIN